MHLKEARGETYTLNESVADKDIVKLVPIAKDWKWQIVWQNVIVFVFLHIGAVYGGYLFFTKAKWASCVFGKYMLTFYD